MTELESLCRVCLEKIPAGKRKFIKLQETPKTHKETTFLQIFEAVSGHVVNLLKEPQIVCLSCGDRLVQAFELRKICDETQKYLKRRIDEIKHETEEIEVKVEAFLLDHVWQKESSNDTSDDEKKVKPERKVKKQVKNTKQSIQKQDKTLCPICGIFRSKKHIEEHIDRSNNLNVDSNGDIIARPFICDLCGRHTTSRNNMFLHMQTKHLHVTMKCKYCKAEFKNRGRLEAHMRKIHTEIKGLLECKFCEYRTVDRSTLHVHLKKHTGKKPHRCDICLHEFITKTKWRDHLATHSDERPFSCETCNANFKTRKTLNTHKKIHLAHDYECPVCAHTYQTSQQLRSHVKKTHPEYPLPPPGTVLSKSWRKRKAEQEMKDLAMKQGADQTEIEKIVIQQPPPIEQKQYFQSYGKG